MKELFDFLNAINFSKEPLMSREEYPYEYSENEKSYVPYVINMMLARNKDTILYANEMNMNYHIDNKLQFEFYRSVLSKRKRYAKKIPIQKEESVDIISKYYMINKERAREYNKLISQDDIEILKSKMDTGGVQKDRKGRKKT